MTCTIPRSPGFLAGTALAACGVWSAHAGDIDSVLTGLYGGDGITLTSALEDHSAHFQGDSFSKLQALSNRALDVSIPMTSGDSGIVFVYDPITDEFESTRASQGTLFSERADTLGKGRASYGFNYQHIEYTRLDGTSIDNLSVDLQHREAGGPGPDVCIGGPPGACHLIELDYIRVNLDLDLEIDVVTFFAGYGITDRWDVGVIVPVMDVAMSAVADAALIEHESRQHSDVSVHILRDGSMSEVPVEVLGDHPVSAQRARDRGLGDIHLRTKYALFEKEGSTLSATGHLRLSNGDEANLRGIPSIGSMWGMLYTTHRPLGPGRLATHLNLVYETNAGAHGQDEVDFNTGLEYSFPLAHHQLALSLDLGGSVETSHKDGVGDRASSIALGARWQPNATSTIFLGFQTTLDRNEALQADYINHMGVFLSL